jgi:hypothetical protein
MTSSQDEASNQDKTNLLAVSGRQSVIVNIPLELINKTR